MTTKTIDVQEAQHQLADLIEQVAAGAGIILTQGDQPRARLVSITPSIQRRVPGLHPGSMTTSPDFDAPLADDFWSGTISMDSIFA
jgi:antitoxin (DNA-binding transcriptional repressor) of toxin-antitoxin stability system